MENAHLLGFKRFLVALSFPGEYREFVEYVAVALAQDLGRERVLYDNFYEAEFARPNLDTYLQGLYSSESKLIVVFLSEEYERKEWPGLEWRAIRDIIKKRDESQVMLLRFDDAEVKGIYSIDGFISLRGREPGAVAGLILERLRSISLIPQGESQIEVNSDEQLLDSVPPLQIDRLAYYEKEGQYKSAIKDIAKNWSTLKSWENLIHYLRLLELAGGDEVALDRAATLEDALYGTCPEDLRIAVEYYRGRLRSQLGFKLDALNVHEKNAQNLNSKNLYAFRSLFEVGQVLFRVEDFLGAQATLKALERRVKIPITSQHRLHADVRKFLGTFEMLHIIFDVPFHEVCLSQWKAGDYRKCINRANETIQLSEKSGYTDGLGWGYTVRAFGEEGAARPKYATDAYTKAESTLQLPGARRSSLIYSLLYRSAFERRTGDFDKAQAVLERAENAIPPENRQPYEAALYEQRSLIAEVSGDIEGKEANVREALIRYSADSGFHHRSEWPQVKRLKALCRSYGWNLSDFFSGK